MTSLPLLFLCGFEGKPKGVTGSPELSLSVRHVASVDFSGSGKQCYDRTNDNGTPLTIGPSVTTILNLTTGLISPLNESISGSNAFAKIYGVLIEHDPSSSASAITAFGGGVQEFQGPFAAGDKPTLQPGKWIAFGCDAAKSGWTVTASTNVQIDLVNTDSSNSATVNVFLLGTTS